ncbi:MAG: flagellar basal-body MS-ring/collar protein FliF [Nocardioides sp.]
MKDSLSRAMGRYGRLFDGFTNGQKVVSVIGTGALLLGCFMVFRWVSAPSYVPLFSDLSSSDASAVIEQLDSSGVDYQLTDGGSTVLVPRDAVYKSRIDLSAEGLPSSSDGGYSILDDQGLSTSEFKEQTDFKRAMEGELSTTIEALDGVETAVVHLALPEKEVFVDEQQPPTASVLVSTRPGSSLSAEQVQAVVHLVASSIEGLDPDKVTVADATGRVLTSPDGTGGADSTGRDQQVEAVTRQLHDRLQSMLDRVVGPGNSTVQVTPVLNFDTSVTESTDYQADADTPPVSSSSSSEVYEGPASGAGATGASGVVGPDGQMDTGQTDGSGESSYTKTQTTEDNVMDTVVERRETTPGQIQKLHVGVVLDAATTQAYSPSEVRRLVADTIGIDQERGDTVRVVPMPFDRSAEEAAAASLKAADVESAAAAKNDLYRKGGLGLLVAGLLGLALLRGRKRNKARVKATTYVVEQLKQETAARAAIEPPGALALEQAAHTEEDNLRAELDALIERQPEDVAALLRGWLTERA